MKNPVARQRTRVRRHPYRTASRRLLLVTGGILFMPYLVMIAYAVWLLV